MSSCKRAVLKVHTNGPTIGTTCAMPNVRCTLCNQWTQRRDRICSAHRGTARGFGGPYANIAKLQLGTQQPESGGEQPQLEPQAVQQPVPEQPPSQAQAQPVQHQSSPQPAPQQQHEHPHEWLPVSSVGPPPHQCQQCKLLRAEVGELRGLIAQSESRYNSAMAQVATLQQRLAVAEDTADWHQAAWRSGGLPPHRSG